MSAALGVHPCARISSTFSRALAVASSRSLLDPQVRSAGDVWVGDGHALLDHLVCAGEDRRRDGSGCPIASSLRDKAHRRIFARKVSKISTTPAAVSGHVLMAALHRAVGSIARYFPRLPPPYCYPYG